MFLYNCLAAAYINSRCICSVWLYIYIKQSPDRVEIHFNQIQAAPVKVAGERRQMHATCVSACM